MRLLLIIPYLLSLTLAAVVAPREEKVSYDGFKVFRINTGDELVPIQEKLSTFDLQPWNIDFSQHMDVAVPPAQVEGFEALGLGATVMHEDLGADIAAEWDATAPTGML